MTTKRNTEIEICDGRGWHKDGRLETQQEADDRYIRGNMSIEEGGTNDWPRVPYHTTKAFRRGADLICIEDLATMTDTERARALKYADFGACHDPLPDIVMLPKCPVKERVPKAPQLDPDDERHELKPLTAGEVIRGSNFSDASDPVANVVIAAMEPEDDPRLAYMRCLGRILRIGRKDRRWPKLRKFMHELENAGDPEMLDKVHAYLDRTQPGFFVWCTEKAANQKHGRPRKTQKQDG